MTHRVGSAASCGRLLAVVMGLIVLASCSGGGGSSSSTGTTPPPSGGSPTNVAAVTVGFGANGSAGGYVNGIWTTVTVCAPGSTTNCQTIPNVLVDTGSVGLRVLSSALGTLSLPQIEDSNGDVLQECIQFASLAYVFGPVAMANVEIGGETASQVPKGAGGTANSGIPIQVIAANPSFAVPASCLSGGVGPDYNTVEALGGNGILGVGNFPYDCPACTTGAEPQYYVFPSDVATPTPVPEQDQVWNPVAAFSSSDTNGVLITLPSVAATGAASLAGSLIFGIGTESNNSTGTAQVYEIDEYGNFPQVTYNGTAYTSPANGSYIDSGSNAIYFSDATSLASTGIVDCGGQLAGYYCPPSTIPFTATVYGANNVSAPVNFSIANAATLFSSGNAVFSNLGAASGTGPATDDLDLGLPFFINRSVFVGIEGANSTYPNGYWAF